jgi:hypothetical protein
MPDERAPRGRERSALDEVIDNIPHRPGKADRQPALRKLPRLESAKHFEESYPLAAERECGY